MKVEHVIDSRCTPKDEKENIHDVHVVIQPPQRSIAADRPKSNIQAPKRLIAEVDVAYALNVAEQIEGIAKPFTYSDGISSGDS